MRCAPIAVVLVGVGTVFVGCGLEGVRDLNSPGKEVGAFVLALIIGLLISGDFDKSATVLPADAAYLAAAAHVAGAADTNWRTDVELHNFGDDPAEVTLWLLAHGQANPEPMTAAVLVGPRASVRLDDVLVSSFGVEDKAAMRITTAGGAVVATDRTYNLLGAGNGLGYPDGATFGQYLPLRGAEDAIEHGDEARLIGLAHDDAARTNLGLVNVMPAPTTARAELYLGDGTRLGRVQTELAPYEYRQITQVFERVTDDPVADGFIVLTTPTEGGAFLADASVVDGVTGDPVYLPAEPMASGAGGAERDLWVVAAAHTGGAAGTNWRTDLTVHNPNDHEVSYDVELLLPNRDNSAPRTVTRTVAAGSSVRHEDVLVELFGADGAAALRIVPDGGPLQASSRTYNLLGPGNPVGLPAGATFGQFIPAVTDAVAVGDGWNGRLIHLAHDPGGDTGFRTNLVLVNLESSSNPVSVELFRADGWLLGTVDLGLEPYEFRQLNRVFERVTSDVVEDGYAVVRSTGSCLALGSVVDNLTGDPVGMMATRVGDVDGAGSLENAVRGVLELLGDPDDEGIEKIVGVVGQLGGEGLADGLANGLPAAVGTANGGVLTLDFGDGTSVGSDLLAGSVTIDFTGLAVTPNGIEGVVSATCEGCATNGVTTDDGRVTVDFDLAIRGDDSVVGTVGLDGGPLAKAAGSGLSGLIEIDTAICLYYPVGGEVSFTTDDGAVVTVRFGPDCDGGLVTEVEPAWDWTYGYGDPSTPHAQLYVDSVVNAHVTHDVADYWTPTVGGTEFFGRGNPGDTPPGVITYRFSFAQPIEAAHLNTSTGTYHFSYSRGHNYVFASRDGSSWHLLLDNPPPAGEGDPPLSARWNDLLPAEVLGSNELWIRVEQYCWGPSAPSGSTNTAQHARFWTGNMRDAFQLEVRCAGAGGCG